VSEAPDDFAADAATLMAARDGHVWLFNRAAARTGEMRVVRWNGESWSHPEAVPVPADATRIVTGASPGGPVVLALVPIDGASNSAGFSGAPAPAGTSGGDTEVASIGTPARIHLAYRRGADWVDGGAMLRGGAPLIVDAQGVAMTVALNRIAVTRPGGSTPNDVGWAKIEPTPTVSWTPESRVPVFRDQPLAPLVHLATLALVLATFVFVRPDKLAEPATLPAHLRIGRPAHRMVAGLIDLLPALFGTAWWWAPTAEQAWRTIGSVSASVDEQAWQSMVFQVQMHWLMVIACYSLYCGVSELFTATTPGKYLLGLRVVDVDLGRSSPGRLCGRNAMRIVELGIHPFITGLTVLVMAGWSRYRHQRLGDLVAGTLVVSPAPPAPPEPPVAVPVDESFSASSGAAADGDMESGSVGAAGGDDPADAGESGKGDAS
jgi:uncharacterized RDD family membrane protein YckC